MNYSMVGKQNEQTSQPFQVTCYLLDHCKIPLKRITKYIRNELLKVQ